MTAIQPPDRWYNDHLHLVHPVCQHSSFSWSLAAGPTIQPSPTRPRVRFPASTYTVNGYQPCWQAGYPASINTTTVGDPLVPGKYPVPARSVRVLPPARRQPSPPAKGPSPISERRFQPAGTTNPISAFTFGYHHLHGDSYGWLLGYRHCYIHGQRGPGTSRFRSARPRPPTAPAP